MMEPHVPILRRVGLALLIYVGVRFVGLVADFAMGASHSVTIDLLSLTLGILLCYGNVRAARWVAFLMAFELTCAALTVLVGLPVAALLVRGLFAGVHFDLQLVWSLFVVVLDVVFALWVLRELRDPAVEAALAAAKRRSIRRAQRFGIGFGVGLVALGVAVLIPIAMMWPRWTQPAVEAAHRQLGDDWEISVRSFNWSSKGWQAHVVARRGEDVKELDVNSAQ
jgi:hypothetical protein